MYTHLLLISTVQISRAYCSFFSIIIYLLCQNKRFVIFYKFEQTCSNVQFIPSPIGEGILATVVKIPILFIFFLHIQQARVKNFPDSGLSILKHSKSSDLLRKLLLSHV